jgi:glutathione S-transferase
MASATKPEVMYFDGPGRANVTRMAFILGGIDFTDTRVADWPAVKGDPDSVPAQLFGSMPCVKLGDTIVAQSVATAAFAAELGLYTKLTGTTTEIAAHKALDTMVLATNEELRQEMYKCLFGSDESKAAGLEALPEGAGKLLNALERAISRQREKNDGPFFHGKEPALADLCIFDNVNSPFPGLKALGQSLEKYPQVAAIADAVAELPAIKEFAANGFKPKA